MRRLAPLSVVLLTCLSSAQTVNLKLKFPRGKEDRLSSVTSLQQTMVTAGAAQKMTMKVAQSMTMLMHVVDSSPSSARVRITYEEIKSVTSVNGSPMTPGADVEKLLKGKSIELTFDSHGGVTRISGLEKLLASTIKNAPPLLQQGLKQMLSDQSVREMWGMMFGGIIPSHPVRVGDTWATSKNFGQAPLRVGMKLKMTLKDLEKRGGHQMAKIPISGTGSLDMAGILPAQVKLKMDSISISGVTYFDLDRGWLNDQTLGMLMHGTATATQNGKSQTTTISMHMTTSTKVVSVK